MAMPRQIKGCTARCIAVVLATLCGVGAAPGETITVTADKDNTIFSGGIASSNALGVLFTGRTGLGNVRRCLVAFDVASSVPAGAVITSARLKLNLQAAGSGAAQSHALHRLSQDWGQGTSSSSSENGGPASIDDVTWAYRFFPIISTAWDNFGGDFEPDPSAAQLVGTAMGTYAWGPTPGMIADVQGWLDDPAASFGWIVIGNETIPGATRTFTNLEDSNPDLRPQLTITYESAACDMTGDQVNDAADLAVLLGAWGHSPGSPADLNDDDEVDAADLALLLGSWGPC